MPMIAKRDPLDVRSTRLIVNIPLRLMIALEQYAAIVGESSEYVVAQMLARTTDDRDFKDKLKEQDALAERIKARVIAAADARDNNKKPTQKPVRETPRALRVAQS